MKYILFAYTDYYPLGGWNDYKGLFNSVEDAKDHYAKGFVPEWADEDVDPCERLPYESGQIVNATSLLVVKEW